MADVAHGSAPTPRLHLSRFPAELLAGIFDSLTNRDIKNVRLTCKKFHAIARLRLDRVFLSQNPLNIRVLREIADSDTFRKGVVELIWDDASLAPSLLEIDEDGNPAPRSDDPDEDLRVYAAACEQNLKWLAMRRNGEAVRPDLAAQTRQVNAEMPREQAWAYYRSLVEQQFDARLHEDENILRHALVRFPSLRRITITPATHGWLFNPLYETPMIRAFPSGFNYPIPRGWPTSLEGDRAQVPIRWDEAMEDEKDQWRGFRVVSQVLADPLVQHGIRELVLDAHHLATGLNCWVFYEPCPEYNNLVSVLRLPGFARLGLALMVREQEWHDWPCFRNGYLRRALAEATNLSHFSLRADVTPGDDQDGTDHGTNVNPNYFVPLRTILPVDSWSNLRHFGLSYFFVTQADLLSLLAALPTMLRSVELSFLAFLHNGGSHRGLLADMRSDLDWRDRSADTRPSVLIGLDVEMTRRTGRGVWIEKEVSEYLYGDGPNPFGMGPNMISFKMGVMRDAFEPHYDRPWMSRASLIRRGFIEWPNLPGLIAEHSDEE